MINLTQEQLEELKKFLESLIPKEKEFLNVPEAIKFLGISESKLYKLTSKCKIPFRKKGRLYFSRKELVEWVLSEDD
jgi:excisionase family DNA binding protein